MTSAARRYEDLTRELLEGRERGEFVGSAGEAREDELLEIMDDCWWKMSEAERDEADRRLEESRKVRAPENLDEVDVSVPARGHVMPRRVVAAA
jgi:hypothetical protein